METAEAEAKLENKSVPNGTYDIDGNGNLTGAGLPDCKLEINMSGNKPTSGTVTIKNGGVSQNETTMVVGDYEVKYNQEKNKYAATTVVYRWSKEDVSIGDIINSSDTSKFTKDASTLGKNYYLKHILDKDNKVTESYACAIFNSKEYCLTNGEYGYAANEADYTGNTLLLKQIRDAKIAGVSCSFTAHDSNCGGGSVSLYANSDGSVNAFEDVGYCNVYDDGSSDCFS